MQSLATWSKFKKKSESLLDTFRTTVHPSSRLIGLDIGSRLIKMVQLKPESHGWKIVNVCVEEVFPEHAGHPAKNADHAAGQVLRRLAERMGMNGARVAVSLSGPSVIIKPIDVPWMTQEELTGHLEWEIERYLPYKPEDIYWDYYAPRLNKLDHLSLMRVYLVAAKRDIVDSRIEFIKRCGMVPVVVDIECFALINAYRLNYEDSGTVPVLLVNLGPSGLTMVTEGLPEVFNVREAAIGEEWSLQVLQEGSRIAQGKGITRQSDDDHSPALRELLQEIYEEITHEITRTLDDCHTSVDSAERVKRVLICGGYARLPALVARLSSQLRLPVEILNPFQKLSFDTQFDKDRTAMYSMANLMAVAVGLGLRHGHHQ